MRTQPVHFYKYHGSGNDFIMIDNRNLFFELQTEFIARLCTRHFGIGADGLILLEESTEHDFKMRYFNSDGKEASMCGNGGRSIVAFAYNLGIIEKGKFCTFDAVDGLHQGIILNAENNRYQINLKMSDAAMPGMDDGNYILDTGSPHFVHLTEKMPGDFVTKAAAIRNNDKFRKEGINVNFIEEQDSKLIIRTFERGVEDETLSCGTGTTAAVLCHAYKNGQKEGQTNVVSRGGNLKVSYKTDIQTNTFTDIWLEGPVMRVFEGKTF